MLKLKLQYFGHLMATCGCLPPSIQPQDIAHSISHEQPQSLRHTVLPVVGQTAKETLSSSFLVLSCKVVIKVGFPVHAMAKNPPAKQKTQVQSLGQEDPLQKEMATHSTPVFLPGKSHGQKNLEGYSPWGRKESDTAKWLNSDNSMIKVFE